MLLSNKLTFCITSLIMLLALGFAVTPVMAHPAGANVAAHGHPSATDSAGYTNDLNGDGTTGDFGNRVDLNDDDDFDDTGEQVPLHNPHPVVTNITLKAGDAVRGTTAAVVADDSATTDVAENTFTLVIDFDRDIADDANTATLPADGAQLATTNLVSSLLQVDNTDVTGSPGFVFNRVDGNDAQYEVVVTPGALPNADADAATANDNTLTFRIQVTAGGLFSLQTVVQRTDSVAAVTIPGGANSASSVYVFTLVEALPDLPVTPTPPDTTGPAISTFTAATADADGNITFTLTFDGPLGTGGLLPSHLMIEGGTLVATGGITPAGAATTYMIKVTPTAPAMEAEVTVTLRDGSVTDNVGNFYRAPATGVVMGRYDTVNPTINAVATGVVNTDGTVTLSITFSEELGTGNDAFANVDIDRTNSNVLLTATDPTMPADQPTDGTQVWTLTVTPRPVDADQVIIFIKERSVADMSGNDLLEDTPVTWTRPGPPADETDDPVVTITGPSGYIESGAGKTFMTTDANGYIDSVSGGMITITATDNIAVTNAVEAGEITVTGAAKGAFTNNMLMVTPNVAATTVTVTVAANAAMDAVGNGNAAVTATFNVGPIFTVPAGNGTSNPGYLVIVKDPDSDTANYLSDQPTLPPSPHDTAPPIPTDDIEVGTWENMPDLERLFNTGPGSGGTLNIKAAATNGDASTANVRITEVMWAIDESKRGGADDLQADEQWVEVENPNTHDVKVIIYARTGRDSANTHINNPDGHIDRIGNAYDGGPGSAPWSVPGENGNSYTGKDFASMWRRYVGNNRGKGYANGTSKGAWSAGSKLYLTSATTNLNDSALYNHKGTPGRLEDVSLPEGDRRVNNPTNVPSSPFIINEVANRDSANAKYEWIEIKNVTGSSQNLRNYILSMVTTVGKDDVLIHLPNNDRATVPAGGVILLLASNPLDDEDHPIAPGYNVDGIDGNPKNQVDGLGLNVTGSNRKPPMQKVVTFQNGGLPDNGDFILLLRKPDHPTNGDHAERGKDDIDKIVDIAGHHEGLSQSNYPPTNNPPNLNSTTLWPLHKYDGDMKPNRGHGDWNHRRHNRIEANKVRYRQHVKTTAKPGKDGSTVNRGGTGFTHKNRGVEHYAFRDAIYTGIGYKRTARVAGYNSGTPGYDGNSVGNTGIVKNTADTADVTISEIMYSTGSAGRLPQWIELYNSSPTNAVNLHNWKLRFEMLDADGNPMDSLMDLNFNSSRSVRSIPPQQTVLIVAGRASQVGSKTKARGDVFNENRVFNVSRDIGAGKFGKNDQYQFFNPTRFHIALLDRDNKVVDAVGNLDGDARTSDTGTWDFPAGLVEEADKDPIRRTSIIRVYDDADGLAGDPGKARTGVNTAESHVMPIFGTGDKKVTANDGVASKWSWIPAVNTERARDSKITVRSTWYGDEDDYGTPNNRPGVVLPVELSFFRPTLENGEVTIRWTTESELDNAGFNILRSETRNGEYKQVNAEMIQGAGTTGERSSYKWVDQTAKPGVVYYYQIEDVSFAGERQALAITKLKGLISAKSKLTTTWSELKASQ